MGDKPVPGVRHPSKTTVADSMASATGTILILFDSAIISAVVIAFTSEITRMTAGTEWRVS